MILKQVYASFTAAVLSTRVTSLTDSPASSSGVSTEDEQPASVKIKTDDSVVKPMSDFIKNLLSLTPIGQSKRRAGVARGDPV